MKCFMDSLNKKSPKACKALCSKGLGDRKIHPSIYNSSKDHNLAMNTYVVLLTFYILKEHLILD